MNALNRETTMAKRLPAALSEPSSARRSGSGGTSATKSCLSFFFVTHFSLTDHHRGELDLIRENPWQEFTFP
jgi:hypothetical protein